MKIDWRLGVLVLVAQLLPNFSYAQFKSYQEISPLAGGFTGHIDDGDFFGESVTALGDLDGDSIPDIAISAQGDDDGGPDRGAVWILFLERDGTVKSHQKISATEGGFTGNLPNGSLFGDKIANLGDVDGDGIIDLAVGAQGDDDGGQDRGAVWILFLNSDGTVKDYQKISSTQGGFVSNQPLSQKVAAIGDFDRDGVPDMAVGSEFIKDGGLFRGAVWIICLNRDGTVKTQHKISDTVGGFTGILDDDDQFGHDVAGLGDLDGDGVVDIAVCAQNDDDGGVNAGAIWILFLNANGTVKRHQKISATQGGFSDTIRAYDTLGEAMAVLGDLNGDGVTDMVVGADYHDDGGKDTGAAWILYLNRDGTVADWEKISNSTPGFEGVLYVKYGFGNDAANIGDSDGDGIVDIVVTSNTSYVGAKVSGSAFVFFLDPVPVVPPGNGGGSGVFQQDGGANGIVSIEVEDFYANVPKIHQWMPVFPAGYSGSSALQAQPNTGIKFDTGYVTGSPRLDFDVNFVKTGTDYIWILGQGATSEDNSVHVGLDGVAISSSDRITGFSTTWTWSKSTIDGPVATINIPSAGVHTVNVWMHEDGFVMDKLVLTASGSYTPTGAGPVESVQVKSLIFDPMVLAFTVEEGGTTDSQAVDLDTDTNGITAYTVSNDANWLLVTPTSGETPDMLTVHVDADGLLPGTYTATITAEAAGYAGEVVDVTLYVIAIPVPALILTPRKLNFSVEKEGTTASLGVDLNTSDGGVTTYTVSDDTGWLEVTPASGTTPGQLTVSVDATDLIPGVYTATITAEGAGYAGAIGSVTLSVTDIDTTSGGCFLSSLYFR